jgi:hypothetical protein
MTDSSIQKQQLDGFRDAAQSLKLYRRAELEDEQTNKPLIEELYVDPLPGEHVFETMMRPNTTFLIGRKGTGKSTIFQRVQHEIRKRSNVTSAYIDIKTTFEKSQIDPSMIERMEKLGTALTRRSLESLLLYRHFVMAVIREIREELKKRLQLSFMQRIKERFTGTIGELFEDLDELEQEANDDRFISVLGLKRESLKATSGAKTEDRVTQKDSVKLSAKPEIEFGDSELSSETTSTQNASSFADILLRTYDMKELIARLEKILAQASIKHLYILVDDFSELPREAMSVVVDTILAPLNNWSNELIKFKVAAYPGRVYYGAIDKTKIDEVYLDIFQLYGTKDVTDMEAKAVDFTQRLVTRRLQHFIGSADGFFSSHDSMELWRQLFFATMGNPRILGYILYFLYESQLLYGKRIGPGAIRDAARRFFEEKIESYFQINRFAHESFAERASAFALKELLEQIVGKAKDLKRRKASEVMQMITGAPPTSHFHVLAELEPILSTLELNFFVTKYYEMSDRDGRKVAIYALNFGLCQKYAIAFGKPSGEREFRLYFVERIFDYSHILSEFMKHNQEILCDHCNDSFGLDMLAALKLYDMQCPKCRIGRCKVVNLSKKYESVLKKVSTNTLLPKVELGMLQTLNTEGKQMYARDIAAALDCSYQLIGKRGRNLDERDLVERSEDPDGRRVFSIKPKAVELYLTREPDDELAVDKED